jgi:tetratricopeptide (TPR) repeat protein
MSFLKLLYAALLVLASAVLSGCVPSAPSQLDEEKEQHFLVGKSRLQQMDYHGAIESFEKALEVNPQSGSAHFELGCLYVQKEPDPAAAIYHFDRYLKLRPRADNLEVVKQQMNACKAELARSIMLGPLNDKVQRELEHVVEENKRLRDEVEHWRAWSKGQTNVPAAQLEAVRTTSVAQPNPDQLATAQSQSAQTSARSTAPASGNRSYTVKQGDTLANIAKKHNVRLETLMAANPRLDARRLKPGQTLSIPGS